MQAPDLRESLIQATVRLLADHAPSEISLRAVARQLGVSSGAPYHHFEDKVCLFAAVALEGWQHLGAAMLQAAEGEPMQRLRACAAAYIQLATSRREHYSVMFLPELRDAERFSDLHAASMGSLQLLMGLVSEATGRSTDDPDLMCGVVGAWSTVHGFAELYNAGVLTEKTDHVGRDELFDGVVAAAVRAALS